MNTLVYYTFPPGGDGRMATLHGIRPRQDARPLRCQHSQTHLFIQAQHNGPLHGTHGLDLFISHRLANLYGRAYTLIPYTTYVNV